MDHLLGYDALSAALIYIRSNVSKIYICTDAPLNFGQVTAYELGVKSIGSGSFDGPEEFYGDPEAEIDSGPDAILHVMQITNIQMSAEGMSQYIALTGGGELLVVAPCGALELEYGCVINVEEWCIRVKQPLHSCFGEGGS